MERLKVIFLLQWFISLEWMPDNGAIEKIVKQCVMESATGI